MKQKFKSAIKYLVALPLLAVPFLAGAQSAVSTGLQSSQLQGIFGTGGLNGASSVSDLIARVIEILLMFGGVIAVVFVVIGGYWYVTSAGNEEQAEKGRKTLLNAIIGVVLIVLSYVIINVIVNLVSSTSGYGF